MIYSHAFYKKFLGVVVFFISFTGSAQAQIKVTMIGDRKTEGFASNDAISIYTKTVESLGTSFTVFNRGRSGYCLRSGCTPSYLDPSTLFVSQALADDSDYYVITLGTNDGRYDPSRGAFNWPTNDAAALAAARNDFVSSYVALISRIRQNGKVPTVILVTSSKIADTNITKTSVAQEWGHSDLNVSGDIVSLTRLVGLLANAIVVDVNPLIDNRSDLVLDGVHLNERGAYKYGSAIKNAICRNPRYLGMPCSPRNIAPDGIATQSSTYISGLSPAFAKYAIDGSKSSNYSVPSTPHQSHTNHDSQPWLEVDLKGIRIVDSIKLTPRTDNGAWQRNQNLYILTSATPFTSNNLTIELERAAVKSYSYPTATDSPIDVNVSKSNRHMRYVRVWLGGVSYLSLAELEIFEAETP
jgi:lysophospholipase L1-like esterase